VVNSLVAAVFIAVTEGRHWPSVASDVSFTPRAAAPRCKRARTMRDFGWRR